jgi:hypothetical protein
MRTEAKGSILQQRLPAYPEFIPALMAKPGVLAERLRTAVGENGLARRAA